MTVIYYTSNTEKPEFETRIQRTLRHMSRPCPIVSVSQKPIEFGENICVGEVGVTGHNALRQFLLGVQAAKTKYVCNAESDFLYPREYFKFVPPRDDVLYYASPVYVLFSGSKQFIAKANGSSFVIVADREHLIKTLEEMFKDKPMWVEEKTKTKLVHPYLLGGREYFTTPPIVTFKTAQNMHKKTPIGKEKVDELEPWGSARGLKRKYL